MKRKDLFVMFLLWFLCINAIPTNALCSSHYGESVAGTWYINATAGGVAGTTNPDIYPPDATNNLRYVVEGTVTFNDQ